ncbi:hypothetical protein [Streptococcus porcorum]|uniref:Uncharacterized protein n=1 Tax=Streptococcus porcorum TaxID=701526 RepID=A0ABV2JFE3_9STRE
MKIIKNFFNQFLSLKWYHQVLSVLLVLILLVLFIRFLIWIVPIFGAILALLIIFTEGEIFSTTWESYKQRKQAPTNPLFITVYHRLTEQGVTELPVSTLQFTQGVEFPDFNQGVYFIHLEKDISDESLADFETKVRQEIKFLSNSLTDCVVSRSKREPFLAIKVRLVSSDEMLLQNHTEEEDF